MRATLAAPLGLLLLTLPSCSTCGPILGPQAEVELSLRGLERAPPPLEIEGAGRLELAHLAFDRVIVKPESSLWLAVATVDATGTLASPFGPIEVSCLGRERIPFVRRGGAFVPAAGPLPTLAEALAVLIRRHQALARGDAASLEGLVAKGYRDERATRERALALARERMSLPLAPPQRFSVRLEKEGLEVLEETPGAAQPPRRARFTLVREGGALRFASGLL